jgi:hypothetical protein
MKIMKYIVFKSEDGCFRGFTTEYNFSKHSALVYFPEEGETAKEFEGPSFDGTDETFYKIKALAEELCKNE